MGKPHSPRRYWDVAVPHLVRIYGAQASLDWNPFALVGLIELARVSENGPQMPTWNAKCYDLALQTLCIVGLEQLGQTTDPLISRTILGFVALVKGLINKKRLLIDMDGTEVQEMIQLYDNSI